MQRALLVAIIAAGCKQPAPTSEARVTLRFGFEPALPSAMLDKATALVTRRLDGYGYTDVHREGDLIAVETSGGSALDVRGIVKPGPAVIELRVDDSESPYLVKLTRHVARDATAATLKIEQVIDYRAGRPGATDRYVKAADQGRYVNVAWADKHHCDAKDRLEGTGVYCSVTAQQVLDAYFAGDKELFIEPIDPALAPPPDHDLAYARLDKETWRTRYLERERIVIEPASTRDVSFVRGADPALRLQLTAPVAELVKTRGTDKLLVIAPDLREVELDGDTLVIAGDVLELVDLEYAFELGAIGAKLVAR